MSKSIASYWRFLVAGILKQRETGAFFPSQRFLISKMLSPLPRDYSRQILELGAGTGALTTNLARHCPAAPILACEINPVFSQDLHHRLTKRGLRHRVEIITESAEHLLATMAAEGNQPQFIISGIPLGNLPGSQVVALLDRIRRALAPGGMYIQFQHSVLDRKKIKARFARLRTVPVFLNLPPAVIYYAQK